MKNLLILMTLIFSISSIASDKTSLEVSAQELLESSIEKYENDGVKEFRRSHVREGGDISVIVLGLNGIVISSENKRLIGKNIKGFKGASAHAMRSEGVKLDDTSFIDKIVSKALKSREGKVTFLWYKPKQEAPQLKTAMYEVRAGVIFIATFFD